jgi:putative heme utilization carrier protein HutX
MSISADVPALARRVTECLKSNPRAMTLALARELQVPEADVVRHLPAERVTELASDRFREMMDRLTAFGKVHVIVSNGATTLEAFGEFGRFSTWGEYFNVQTKSLDMHIRHEQIGAVFAVEKPGHMDGVTTLSLQFYDQAGDSAFKVFLTFGQHAPTPECRARWEAFRDEFKLS